MLNERASLLSALEERSSQVSTSLQLAIRAPIISRKPALRVPEVPGEPCGGFPHPDPNSNVRGFNEEKQVRAIYGLERAR
jgi:hypothetical protein